MKRIPENTAARAAMATRLLALAGLLALLWPAPAEATRVRDVPLPEMVAAAGHVVAGRVLSLEDVERAGIPATRVTLEVERAIKGDAGATLSLVFAGGRRPGGLDYRLPGMPTFSVGDELVLMVYPPSEAGLTAPVGLYQGALPVRRGADGSRQVLLGASQRAVVTGLRQAGLLHEGAPGAGAAPRGGPAAAPPQASGRDAAGPAVVPFDLFLEHLRQLAAGERP